MHISVGDKVKIISGEGRGNIGVVSGVDYSNNIVRVSGQKVVKRSRKLNGENKDNFVNMDGAIHVSNVQLVQRKKVSK